MKILITPVWRFLLGLRAPSKTTNTRLLRERGETVASLAIREATVADIPALADLHVKTWNATYAGMFMKGPTYEIRERQWRLAFAKEDGSWFCFVIARQNGELVGFAKGVRSDHPDFSGELNKIYLLREYQHLGLGRRLVGHVTRRFLSQGIGSMCLFGDARNPSCRVWEVLGAERIGWGNYGWRDLRKLASMCPIE
jgi:GNAT superfamily N-acetyltransferase